jgi:hypothetical protein
MLAGQKSTIILEAKNGVVRLCHDKVTCSYSIGIRTNEDFEWKIISEELYTLLVKELSEQDGNRFNT